MVYDKSHDYIGFVRALTTDIEKIHSELNSDDSPTTRRNAVRCTFSAMEGVIVFTRDLLKLAPAYTHQLGIHEQAALREESYIVDESGVVRVQPRSYPLATTIRLLVNTVRKYRPSYSVDFGTKQWSDFKESVQVRNRIVHPKRLHELTITDRELEQCRQSLEWIASLMIELLQQTLEHTRSTATTTNTRKTQKRARKVRARANSKVITR